MSKIIVPGSTVHVIYRGRIRHAVVEAVADQNNITVRIGRNSAPTEFNADRVASTRTRGTIFQAE
jgi:hypothetical protein